MFHEWSVGVKDFDSNAVLYPNSFTLCAFDEEGPLAFLPVQIPQVFGPDKKLSEPFMLETLIFRPTATQIEQTRAMWELIQSCITLGYMRGTGEIYFMGNIPSTNQFAERRLFEKLDWPVYRLRLSDLTKEKNADSRKN